jgi:hypothetical protein
MNFVEDKNKQLIPTNNHTKNKINFHFISTNIINSNINLIQE